MKSATASKVKVTFMVPQEIWEEFKKLVPPGKRSQALSEALKKRMEQIKVLKELELIETHQKRMKERFGVLPSSVEDIRELREEGRDAGLQDRG